MSYETKQEAGYSLLSVKGEIDISNSDEFMGVGLKTFAESPGPALLDLSGVTYLDSSAINVIFTLSQRLTLRSRELRLVIPSHSRLHRLVQLTGLNQVAEISPTVDDAARGQAGAT